MSKPKPLLFQVGQLAESRSFDPGYRGAWFRCEIKEVARNKGQIRYHVRYYDYDADGLDWLDLYNVVKSNKNSKEKRELMLRPQFPPIYHENELPDMNAISDVAVVVDGGWSAGDMVDWLEEGCYWFGTITKILGDDTAEVKLPDEPVGEGHSYVASCKDLRPALDWSPDSGWTFPVAMENQNGHSHARLIQPVKQAPVSKSLVNVVVEAEGDQNKATPRSLLNFTDSISSHSSVCSLPALSRLKRSKGSPKKRKDIPGKDREEAHGVSSIQKPNCSDSVSSVYAGRASAEVPVASSSKKHDPENVSAKKTMGNEPIRLNSTSCDSIESSILDLEELVCRVKWLKQILKPGSPSTSRDDQWDFQEFPSLSSEPK